MLKNWAKKIELTCWKFSSSNLWIWISYWVKAQRNSVMVFQQSQEYIVCGPLLDRRVPQNKFGLSCRWAVDHNTGWSPCCSLNRGKLVWVEGRTWRGRGGMQSGRFSMFYFQACSSCTALSVLRRWTRLANPTRLACPIVQSSRCSSHLIYSSEISVLSLYLDQKDFLMS